MQHVSRSVVVFPHGCVLSLTPLQWLMWAKALESHPDQDFSAYIVEGLRNGFRLGFNYTSHACTSAKRNMLSAFQHPKVIGEYLEEETRLVV